MRYFDEQPTRILGQQLKAPQLWPYSTVHDVHSNTRTPAESSPATENDVVEDERRGSLRIAQRPPEPDRLTVCWARVMQKRFGLD